MAAAVAHAATACAGMVYGILCGTAEATIHHLWQQFNNPLVQQMQQFIIICVVSSQRLGPTSVAAAAAAAVAAAEKEAVSTVLQRPHNVGIWTRNTAHSSPGCGATSG
jgi:hypothetical protein